MGGIWYSYYIYIFSLKPEDEWYSVLFFSTKPTVTFMNVILFKSMVSVAYFVFIKMNTASEAYFDFMLHHFPAA